MYIYLAGKIPKPPGEASTAMRPVKKIKRNRSPTQRDHELVSKWHSSINKARLPTESEFEEMKISSTNVKGKFSELKDARDGAFIDTIAQLVMEPYDLGDKFTLWISDYTANPAFYRFSYDGRAEDPYGYGYGTKSSGSRGNLASARPLGSLSMQVTCYEPHASIIRSEGLKATSWVSLRNLQIKFGSNSNNLEGFLRGDRVSEGSTKINISNLDFSEDPETIDPRLKNAVRRKRSYEKEKKHQIKDLTEAAIAGQKRRGTLTPAGEGNSKAKRKKARAQLQKNGKGQSTPPDVDVEASRPLLNPSGM